jgi:hypothetical protein
VDPCVGRTPDAIKDPGVTLGPADVVGTGCGRRRKAVPDDLAAVGGTVSKVDRRRPGAIPGVGQRVEVVVTHVDMRAAGGCISTAWRYDLGPTTFDRNV